jgi:hypothetical protein
MENPVSDVVYISDRGDPFEVASMETSHLMNVIGHHLHQIETLSKLKPCSNILNRRQVLNQVIQVLSSELETREPDIEEYFEYE